ncbi:hypothetical protein [Corynebacterium antarcticum]|uniref:hypothetical protein n=1 Tax=Corynebacterium antarcticum TaxID=2800405 RepID=UPI002002E744|nr:hypothetical protein [Corynebacterium antarcticum]MCK7661990.1 hypothetical protein [Corynebacterium antarcticum]
MTTSTKRAARHYLEIPRGLAAALLVDRMTDEELMRYDEDVRRALQGHHPEGHPPGVSLGIISWLLWDRYVRYTDALEEGRE